MVKSVNFLLLAVTLAGCCLSCTYDLGGMFVAGSSVQERFRNSMDESEQAHYPKSVVVGRDNYRFLVATDLHIKSSQWDRVNRFFSFAQDSSNLMTLLLGDYMYEAGTSLDELASAIASHKNLRVFPAIGNHDVYRDGYQKTYRSTFGPTCYYFKVVTVAGSDLFIILDSANGTLGVDQTDWLRTLLSAERVSCRHCFVFTHANFFGPAGYFDVISSYPVEEQMKLLDIFADYHVTSVFTGHSHYHDETTIRGVKYVTLDPWLENKKGGEYCLVECSPDGNIKLNFEKVDTL